ncbi:MAG: transporter substrate-binding domain-containing protein [Actinomycetota bacterium]
MRLLKLLSLLFAFSLVAAACGGDDDDTATDETTDTTASDETTDTTVADDADDGAADDDDADDGAVDEGGDCATLATKADGVLTVATGEPVFEPWMVDDDPENGQGFESALVYALADELEIEEVVWVRTGFDAAIAPGAKDYDFNIQQYSITADRDEVVDFSDGYYQVEQAIVGRADGDLSSATSLADLTDAQLGAAVGTTSLDYIETVIEPGSVPLAFNDNAAAKSAFDADQVDGIVFDLPTAYFITAVEIPEAAIIGVLPRSGEPEELGLLFEEGSPLVPCVNEALAALRDGGVIEALEDEWLNQGGSIPSLTN